MGKRLKVIRFVVFLAVFAFLAAQASANAYEPNKITSIYGAGSVSCGDFVATRQESDIQKIGRFKQWIYGYFTAVSMYYPPANNKHFLETTNHESIMARIDSYCRKNPAANLHDAVKSLQDDLLQVGKRK